MTNNAIVETMLDKWGDELEIMTVKESINEHPTIYITQRYKDESGNDTRIMILDLAGLDQLILLLQNARERLTENVD